MKLVKDFFNDIIKYWYLVVLLLGLIILRILGYENCLFHLLFKYPCPSCGLTRAFLAFFKGDFKLAFYYHPLFILIPLVLLLFFFRKVKALKALYYKNIIWYFIIIIFLLTYIIRVLISFPKPFIN